MADPSPPANDFNPYRDTATLEAPTRTAVPQELCPSSSKLMMLNLTAVLICAVTGAILGGIGGVIAGTIFPGYYYTVFSDDIDAVETAGGLGLTQGLGLGVAIGLFLAVIHLVYRWRLLTLWRRENL